MGAIDTIRKIAKKRVILPASFCCMDRVEKYYALLAVKNMSHARLSDRRHSISRIHDSGHPKTAKPTVQLWTDENAKEFAIRLSIDPQGVFRAASDLGADYNNLANELEICKLNTSGWNYMLEKFSSQWLASAEAHLHHSQLAESKLGDVVQQPSRGGVEQMLILKVQRETQKRIRPHLQCHFCRLRYFAEEDREAHEKMWHAAKLKTISQQIQPSGGQLASSTS
ncbi:MAG: hypothetical protein ABI361_02255 [Nitrososphaera sp.]